MRIRFIEACLALAICLAALAPLAAAQEPDYSEDLTSIILSARSYGGALTVGVNTITLTKEGVREVLTIAGTRVTRSNEGKPLASPCIIAYRYILAAERENLSAQAVCPKDALAIQPRQKYEETAMLVARQVFRILVEEIGELNRVDQRDA